MNLNRIMQYYNLLEKGVIEFRNRTANNLTLKEQELTSLQKSPLSKDEIALKLKPIVTNNIQMCQRVNKWLDSKDKNVAFNILKESIDPAYFMGLGNEIKRVVDLSEKSEWQMKELLYNYEEQLRFLEKSQKYNIQKFTRKYSKLVKKEKAIFEQLLEENTECESIKSKLMPYYWKAVKVLSGVAAGAIPFATRAAAESSTDQFVNTFLNAASPSCVYNMNRYNVSTTQLTNFATQTTQNSNYGMIFAQTAGIGVLVFIITIAIAINISDNYRYSKAIKKFIRKTVGSTI